MTIELNVKITDTASHIQLPDSEGKLTVFQKENIPELQPENFYLYFCQRQLVGYSYQELLTDELKEEEYDEVILIELPWELEGVYLHARLSETETQRKLVSNQLKTKQIPQGARVSLETYYEKLKTVLKTFGFNFSPAPEVKAAAKPGKPRHRWSKEIAEIDFFINSRQSQATVRWQKRNEMLIKAGAVMKPDTPLNKDGSVGFAAKMTEKIRSDHQTSFKAFKTTEDIILKSVNEVGLFLYFGGTNSWLEIKDKDGKTINEWTVVS